MREIERLLLVLRAVPILAVDVKAARARGDHDAIAYAKAVERWQDQATRALVEAETKPVEQPSAFERVLLAAERSRSPAANANDVLHQPA